MENNKKERKKLLLVIAIFVLLMVLSIGGVYAYFSARATNSGSQITGRTLDIGGSTLSISAQRVTMNPSTTPVSDNLVPAVYGASPTEITTTEVNRALTKQCSLDGYTGCHVWKITASTTQTVASASIKLNLRVDDIPGQSDCLDLNTVSHSLDTNNVVASPLDFSVDTKYEAILLRQQSTKDKSRWSYVVYTGTDSSATSILNKGSILNDFPDSDTTIDIHNGAALTANTPAIYYVMVYLNNINSVQNDSCHNETGIYNGSVILEAMGGAVRVNFLDSAAEYITSLYTNATKSTATVNNITYNLAPSVGLMNDRHASMSTDINGGDIRYYGANPNNYVWLGDSYMGNNWEIIEEEFPFTTTEGCLEWIQNYGVTDEQIAANTPYSTAAEFCAIGEHKKLWRIVGVFDGRLKLVSNDPIKDVELSWDTSVYNVNYGFGINQWGSSGSYEGADLMRLLNEGYTGINGSLYWNKGTGTVYTANNNSTTANVSFVGTGLSNDEKNMIDTVTWYTGAYAYDNASYVDAHYTAERGNMGKICSGGNWCNDEVTRTSNWTGKVGLIYASDYGYATDLSLCNTTISNYNGSGCYTNDWLKSDYSYWTMSALAFSGDAYSVFTVDGGGHLDYGNASNVASVRSAVYLKRDVGISGGTGTTSDPYVLWW